MELRAQRTKNRRGLLADGVNSHPPGWTQLAGVAASLVLLWCAMAAGASAQVAAPAQVAVLVESRASIYQQAAQGFEQGFADRVERIYLEPEGRALEASFESLRRNPPRLVVAIGTQAALTAKQRLPNIPILYCLALRPDQNELVGSNIGGVALDINLSDQLERIRQALPSLRRIGVVYDELTSGPLVEQARRQLQPAGVQVVPRPVRTAKDAAREIQELMGNLLGSQDAFWLLWDSVTTNQANFKQLVDLSLKYRVPLIAPARPFVEAGALISVGADYEQAGRQVAEMARQVLSGAARPGEFVARPPEESIVTISEEVARRLRIRFPADLRADVVLPSAAGPRAP